MMGKDASLIHSKNGRFRRMRMYQANQSILDFVRVGEVLPEVLKEIALRVELRLRLEGERGFISDDEFLEMVERSGGVEL